MPTLVCYFYGCLSIMQKKNQHHSSIKSWHIADLILDLIKIFVMPRSIFNHTHINGLNHLHVFMYTIRKNQIQT